MLGVISLVKPEKKVDVSVLFETIKSFTELGVYHDRRYIILNMSDLSDESDLTLLHT